MATKNKPDKAWAFIGIFLGIVGFILVLLAKRDSKYAMFYAKQGLVIYLFGIVVFISGIIPLLGSTIKVIGTLIIFVLWIVGLVYSLSGKMKDVPLVGEFAKKFNI